MSVLSSSTAGKALELRATPPPIILRKCSKLLKQTNQPTVEVRKYDAMAENLVLEESVRSVFFLYHCTLQRTSNATYLAASTGETVGFAVC